MPWKECNPMSEKILFISKLLSGERMTDVCWHFGISRKTGYKIWNRFLEHGESAFVDQSRRPLTSPNRTPDAIVDLIIDFRLAHPTWGPKKIKVELGRRNPGISIPAASTIGEILSMKNLVKRRKRRRRASPSPLPLSESKSPNDIWCADFKGHFRMKDKNYCYPLTISDHFSRFLLCCDAQENTQGVPVKSVFANTFTEYGLPKIIRVDNGVPFASVGLLGLSKLSVWWLRLGICVERIEPGHPEQNGRHERMHLTLKQGACRPPSSNIFTQQERFDSFREEYNSKRPHEALNMKYPKDIYEPSSKAFTEELEELTYPLHDCTRKIGKSGEFRYKDKRIYVSQALAGENIGFREIDPQIYVVHFMDNELGIFDQQKGVFSAKNA